MVLRRALHGRYGLESAPVIKMQYKSQPLEGSPLNMQNDFGHDLHFSSTPLHGVFELVIHLQPKPKAAAPQPTTAGAVDLTAEAFG